MKQISQRVFYVDAALSVVNKEGKKYWKCSVVENEKNIINFISKEAEKNTEAEAYAILKTILWLTEQNYRGKVLIYSDYKNLSYLGKKWPINSSLYPLAKPTKYRSYIEKAYQLTSKNKINLNIEWIAGEKNPADYYSRIPLYLDSD